MLIFEICERDICGKFGLHTFRNNIVQSLYEQTLTKLQHKIFHMSLSV